MIPKTVTKPEESTLESQLEIECAHHWIIEPPNDPISKGVCKLCGAEKEFENWGFELSEKNFQDV